MYSDFDARSCSMRVPVCFPTARLRATDTFTHTDPPQRSAS